MKAYTDGACRRSNPGVCSCAWVLYDGETTVAEGGFYLGHQLHTNNFAEYMGLIHLLEYLYVNKITGVTIHCDSKLVVNQVNQSWEINSDELRKLASQAFGVLTVGRHTLVHIKGHDGIKGNERADELCNKILDDNIGAYENHFASGN